MRVIEAAGEPNCARKILLGDTATPDAPFQENLLLDCTDARAAAN
jgi:hypothetical protein